ncbi:MULTISPECIES: MBL fold metallo-hydrolase RNA specificity domain-containing protein [Anaerostipes]|uniref:MBL fold metallo-hydrolase RNA specificity domain-containing protein n=1 Tax=Anaerostipes TaxID=207244 RepID=UPI000952CB63|nr:MULTISPECIES: MBL fold metallo-hydrolase [Anaerostipes]MCI5622771.1 MBL fold metallo-hydrolase [Anaerostipes sp.]MDY2725734.1 MBL fold metallo-hydrolase [Anaerostipes faecalis]OLR58908.1 MBL fold hydrolase [Anaerostipes sp. 494a]
MKLMFIGADHEVTGSCHYVEACGKKFVVDFGMEQGQNIYENAELPVSAAKIDFVLLTHAHIDHSGMLPMLYAKGFRGKIYATKATTDLCQIMLRDSAHIQEFEAEWRNRKARRSGKAEVVPVYTVEDAINVMNYFVACPYDKKISLYDGIEIRFTDIGHLLGSSSIEVWLREEDNERKLVFSGDIGNYNQPLIKDPHYTDSADYIIMESTYGDRFHGKHPNYVDELAEVIQRTFDRGGNVVIPSFAVGRTQELLYYIRQIKEDNLVKNHGDFKVIVDSPLAVEATQIFNSDVEDTYDEEAMELVQKGINPITFSNLHLSITTDESKAINFDQEPKVIISASGMCDAGRIRHHLKHNLWKTENCIVFVGYQAYGTLGRALVEGVKEVKLFGENISVKAEILRLEGISGHADKNGLIRWVEEFKKKPEKVFVVHGEDKVCDMFAECLKDEHGIDAQAPFSGDVFDLISGRWIAWGTKELVKKKAHPASSAFIRLKTAGERLQVVIDHNENGTNKDLAKFADQILALCEKWER